MNSGSSEIHLLRNDFNSIFCDLEPQIVIIEYRLSKVFIDRKARQITFANFAVNIFHFFKTASIYTQGVCRPAPGCFLSIEKKIFTVDK